MNLKKLYWLLIIPFMTIILFLSIDNLNTLAVDNINNNDNYNTAPPISVKKQNTTIQASDTIEDNQNNILFSAVSQLPLLTKDFSGTIYYPTSAPQSDTVDNVWGRAVKQDGTSDLQNVAGYGTPVPGEFSFTPGLSYLTKYYRIENNGKETLLRGSNVSTKVKTTYRVTNVGIYKGQSLDILYTLYDDSPGTNYSVMRGSQEFMMPTISRRSSNRDIRAANSDFLGITASGMSTSGFKKTIPMIKNTITYVHSGTNNPVKSISGMLTHSRLSPYKAMYLNPDTYVGGRVPKEASKNRTIVYNIPGYNNDDLWISSNRFGGYVHSDNAFSELYTAKDGKLPIEFYVYNSQIYYYAQPGAVSPVLLDDPFVSGNSNDNASGDNKISWKVYQTISEQPENSSMKNYKLYFNAPNEANVDISNIKVSDSAGRDLSNYFNYTMTNLSGKKYIIATLNNQSLTDNSTQIEFDFSGKIDFDKDSDSISNYLKEYNGDTYVEMNAEAYSTYSLNGNNYETKSSNDKSNVKILNPLTVDIIKNLNYGELNPKSIGIRNSIDEFENLNPVIKIKDMRAVKAPTRLTVAMKKNLNSNGKPLDGNLRYYSEPNKFQEITNTPITINQSSQGSPLSSIDWNSEKGIKLYINKENPVGNYKGELEWNIIQGD